MILFKQGKQKINGRNIVRIVFNVWSKALSNVKYRYRTIQGTFSMYIQKTYRLMGGISSVYFLKCGAKVFSNVKYSYHTVQGTFTMSIQEIYKLHFLI